METAIEYDQYTPSAVSLPVKDSALPPVIRDIVSNAPASRKVQSFIASLSPLCALATRVRLNYFYDSRPSALLLQVIIEGSQSVGKSFAADIERLIMDGTLKARDLSQRRLEQDYRERKKLRKANERLEEEPKTTIRVIPATISKTVLVKRSDMAVRQLGDVTAFWMFAEELAQVTDAGKQGYSNLRTILRGAYDLGSTFGLDFASDSSYSAIVDINICSMFCATPAAVDDMYSAKHVEGGNITRLIMCPIDDSLGADGAIFRPYSERQKEEIGAYLGRMMDDTYTPQGALRPTIELDMSWIDRTVRTWCQIKGHEASLGGSMALDVFRKRASVSAFRVAALCCYLYRMDPKVGEGAIRSRCKEIYLFMAEYILQGLLSRWGKKFEELCGKRDPEKNAPAPGIFSLLPDEFTREELKALAQEQGRTTPARMFIYMWSQSGDIVALDRDRFRKVHRDEGALGKGRRL